MLVLQFAIDVLRGALRRGTIRRLLFVDVLALGVGLWFFQNQLTQLAGPAEIPGLVFEITIPLSLYLIIVSIPVAALAIQRDVDEGTIQTMLAHPLGRGEYVFGKWVGLTALGSANAAVVIILFTGTGLATSNYASPNVLAAVAYEGVAIGVVTALVLAWARFGPFTGASGTLLLASASALLLGSKDLGVVAFVVMPVWSLWGGAILAAAPPGVSAPYGLAWPGSWGLAGAAVWAVAVLRLAAMSLNRIDL